MFKMYLPLDTEMSFIENDDELAKIQCFNVCLCFKSRN